MVYVCMRWVVCACVYLAWVYVCVCLNVCMCVCYVYMCMYEICGMWWVCGCMVGGVYVCVFACVHVYLCVVCVWSVWFVWWLVYVCVCMCVYIHMFIWKSDVSTRCVFLNHPPLCFFVTRSNRTEPGASDWAQLSASEPQELTHLPFPSTGITGMSPMSRGAGVPVLGPQTLTDSSASKLLTFNAM